MKRKCCVPNCKTGTKCTICSVAFSFFKIPRDPSMIKKWELALGLKSHGLRLHGRICNLHFRKADIVIKRFVCMKRPSTNTKMILEESKLSPHAVPTIFSLENKQCSHRRGRFRSTIKCNAKSCRRESATSKTASSPSDDTDGSSADDRQRPSQASLPAQSQTDFCAATENVADLSNRRQVRALNNLRAKWLEDKKILGKEIRRLEARIAEFDKVDKEQTFGE